MLGGGGVFPASGETCLSAVVGVVAGHRAQVTAEHVAGRPAGSARVPAPRRRSGLAQGCRSAGRVARRRRRVSAWAACRRTRLPPDAATFSRHSRSGLGVGAPQWRALTA